MTHADVALGWPANPTPGWPVTLPTQAVTWENAARHGRIEAAGDDAPTSIPGLNRPLFAVKEAGLMTHRTHAPFDRDKSPDIRAIPTRYAGCRFRSRTEARWAIFFTNLNIQWEYEKQGFLVGKDQRPYLPDFYLPSLGLWVEVKAVQPPNIDDLWLRPLGLRNWEDFAGEVATKWDHDKTAMFVVPIPDPADVDSTGPPQAERWYDPGIVILGDWHYAWCACPSGRHFDIQYEARGGRIECGCPRVLDGRLQNGNHPAILNAYATARSARFEHGEVPG